MVQYNRILMAFDTLSYAAEQPPWSSERERVEMEKNAGGKCMGFLPDQVEKQMKVLKRGHATYQKAQASWSVLCMPFPSLSLLLVACHDEPVRIHVDRVGETMTSLLLQVDQIERRLHEMQEQEPERHGAQYTPQFSDPDLGLGSSSQEDMSPSQDSRTKRRANRETAKPRKRKAAAKQRAKPTDAPRTGPAKRQRIDDEPTGVPQSGHQIAGQAKRRRT